MIQAIAVIFLTTICPAWAAEYQDGCAPSLEFAEFLIDRGDYHLARRELRTIMDADAEDAFAAERLLVRVNEASEKELLQDRRRRSTPDRVLLWLVDFYQSQLRSFKEKDFYCPSYPSCSEYAVQAVKKHGAVLGWFMLVDRLWRESALPPAGPTIRARGKWLRLDLPEQNDFWLPSKK